MKNITLTLKNYRCFADAHPLRIELRDTFVALLGPNNTGKSSLLRFFYEFRPAFVLTAQQFGHTAQHRKLNGNAVYSGLSDPLEIFTNTNPRALTIEIEIAPDPSTPQPVLCKAVIKCNRNSPHHWDFELFALYPDASVSAVPTSPHHSTTETTIRFGDLTFDFAELRDAFDLFASTLYLGPFRNAINGGATTDYDIAVGTGFTKTWNSWKAGPIGAQNAAIKSVERQLKRIFAFDSLEINASDNQNSLKVFVNDKPYLLQTLGSGLAQFIIVLGNAATRQARLILIDEPEINLHPSLQDDFLTTLGSYATDGVIYATHSLGLAKTTAERTYSFVKEGDHTVVKEFMQTSRFAEFMGEMSFAAYRETGCDQILLVEGGTDVKTIKQLLQLFGKEHRMVVWSLGGDQFARDEVDVELDQVKDVATRIFAIVDSERDGPDEPPVPKRLAFAMMCERLKIPTLVTHRRAIENYLTDPAIKDLLGPKYRQLGHYEKLSDCVPSWGKHQNWRIASKMRRADIADTDLGVFLNRL